MAEIKVYTKNGCPQCDMTKRVLEQEGLEYKLVNIDDKLADGVTPTDEAQEARDYIVNDLGFMAMPVVVAEGHEPFSGFRPDKLMALK